MKRCLIIFFILLFNLNVVYAHFVYDNQSASSVKINNKYAIDNWNYYPQEFPLETDDGKLNQGLLEAILDELVKPSSLINQALEYSAIKDYDFYLTSEDIIKGIKVKDYFNQPKELSFVIERVSFLDSVQTYCIYSTCSSMDDRIITPVYKTKLTWEADGFYPFDKTGTYRVDQSQSGYAEACKIRSRKPAATGLKIKFFDYTTWKVKEG